MGRWRAARSLKNKLICYFLLITVFPAVAVSLFYYHTSQASLQQNMVKTAVNELAYIGDMIERQMKFAEQLSDWAFINPSLDRILTRHYVGMAYDKEVYQFLDLMDFQLRNASVGSYVTSFLIVGQNGVDLRVGAEAAQIDLGRLRQAPWFIQALAHHGKKNWYGIAVNPAKINSASYIIPLARPIFHSDVNRVIGWQLLVFHTHLIADLLKNYEMGADEMLMVVDSRGYCIFDSRSAKVGTYLGKWHVWKEIQTARHGGTQVTEIAGHRRMVSYAPLKLTGWRMVKVLSTQEFNRQNKILIRITLVILFSSLVFTGFLTVFLTTQLTGRLQQLLGRTHEIAAGHFARNSLIEGRDELGILGRGINQMAQKLQNLLQKEIENQQEKRRLELEILQNQVNPHFLYNTLNSLKVMATLQKADGIREMVTALGRLLMNLSKNQAEKITLGEEIALLNDYISIQNIRYKGKIQAEYQIDDPSLLACKILKFSLQPLVENAIFHGIEPKKDAGRITIGARQMEQDVLIWVEDDGVGMTSQQIAALSDESAATSETRRGLSQIGIRNIAERIRLVYGPKYGLSIASVWGVSTKVTLTIPGEK